MKQTNLILVDGANVSYLDKTHKDKPKVKNITAVKDALEKAGYSPLVIVDASFRYEADDQELLEKLYDEEKVRQAPAQTEADYFVIQMAEDTGAYIVSNDQFEPFLEDHPWIEDRRIPVMVIDGNVTFYKLPSPPQQHTST